MSNTVQPCAGAVVLDQGRLLVIRRGQEPGRGLWSVPGGRCLPGEEPAAACTREALEETGLLVNVVRRLGDVERSGPAGVRYLITDYLCTAVGGVLRAADDAIDARWVTRAELDELRLVPELVRCLEAWGVLPD